jgi:hypothetical protein
LASVLSIAQVRVLYDLSVEWVKKGNTMPTQRDSEGWHKLIGDHPAFRPPIHPFTLWNAILGNSWLFLHQRDAAIRTFQWEEKHFIGGQVPKRYLSPEQLAARTAQNAKPPSKKVTQPPSKPSHKGKTSVFASSAFLEVTKRGN